MRDLEHLEKIESKLFLIAKSLNECKKKISKDNITKTDLECVSSNYRQNLDIFSKEIMNIRELFHLKLESPTDNDLNNSNLKSTENLDGLKKDSDFLNDNVRKSNVENIDKNQYTSVEFKSELSQDCSNRESSCSMSRNEDATVINSYNKTLLTMPDLNNIESKPSLIANSLNEYNGEHKLKELFNCININEPDIGTNSKSNFDFDITINKIPDYKELISSALKKRRIELVKKTDMVENNQINQELNFENKSSQRDTINKNNQQKHEESEINLIEDSYTDYSYSTKLESSRDNDLNNSDLKSTENLDGLKKDSDFLNDNVRKSNVKNIDKKDIKPETQINEKLFSKAAGSKCSFSKILLSRFLFALVFVLFFYFIKDGLERDFILFNPIIVFDDHDI